MTRFAPAFLILSWVIMGFSFAFWVPLAWDWWGEGGRNLRIWLGSFGLTFFTGLWLWWRTRRHAAELTVRDGFLLVNLVWLVLPAYAAVPLWFTVPGIGVVQAYFEAMSGLTATGATSLAGLDVLATSINIWRCFLQLIGGLGIMLLALAVLPFLGLGGLQIFKAEMPGPMKDSRLTPRIAETARGMWGVYFVLSVACLLAYRAGGMSWADAFMHMCTTVGLGGLSSHDQSFAFWGSPQLEWTAVLFMALAGVSFARYFLLWQLRSLAPLTRDAEVRAYVTVLLLASAGVAAMLITHDVYEDFPSAVRHAAFQVVSVATTTGYSIGDYLTWPTFVPVLLLFLGSFVSCAGSTGGGIKMVRMLVLVRLASGLDVVTAFSAVIANVNNIGPGMGRIGPAGNYASFTDPQLALCALAMVLGRLELLSMLVLFTPAFWRR
ncbi:TrkH family potassium uptake protein [Ottowia pentelensis]|uniref:TrkH family potassium uptake protein n=1 Tax=Ottowia pentelensis TaxID=511108 RepID=A0ABV6PW26_9BURK